MDCPWANLIVVFVVVTSRTPSLNAPALVAGD
jgi:hypothetical protein